MTTAAGFGRYEPLPAMNAGPSLRNYRTARTTSSKPMGSSSSPDRAAPLQSGGVAPAAQRAPTAVASTSPRKKQVKKKGAHLPEVPSLIADVENGVEHVRGRLLGQGGFARVYEVRGPDGRALAFKAILKDTLVNHKKSRSKVLAEILIHRSMDHRNIIKFMDLFQDETNIYYKLELCANGSLNDMIKTRGRCLEEETRFYMIQILAACQYMHNNHVIHRDLKLGNILLDANMHIKIGDFGLAALLKDPEERKRTVCGTPNYIAPEILYQDRHGEGHSFEVDVWSVGVILYTLLIGRPPFQTDSVQGIYDKIRQNQYTVPDDVDPLAGDLIRSILTRDPSDRPSLIEIMNHPWFTSGPIPLHIPSTAARYPPHLGLVYDEEETLKNMATLKAMTGWRDDADDEVEEEEMSDEERRRTAREKRKAQEKAEDDQERMDIEFERAIQPGSSLAAFLTLGRQSLVKIPQGSAPLRTKPVTGLARQLSALSVSRQQGSTAAGSAGAGKVGEVVSVSHLGDKENAASGYPADSKRMPPPNASTRARNDAAGADERRMLGQKARLVAGMADSSERRAAPNPPRQSLSDATSAAAAAAAKNAARPSSMELAVQRLNEATKCFDNKVDYIPIDAEGNAIEITTNNQPDKHNKIRQKPMGPKRFVICWLDEMDRYGLGFALSDGSVGTYFRDDSAMSVNAARSHFDHISRAKARSKLTAAEQQAATGSLQKRENFAIPRSSDDQETQDAARSSMSSDVVRKFKILSYFEDKIMTRLAGVESPLMEVDEDITAGMAFVWKWYRCMQAIVFRLSSGVVQFNFYDHSKLLISQDGLVLSVIEAREHEGGTPVLWTWTTAEFFSIAERTRSRREHEALKLAERDGVAMPESLALTTHEERALVRNMMPKLKYALETLSKILNNNQSRSTMRSSQITTRSSTEVLSTTKNGSTTSLPRSGSGQSLASTAGTR